LKGCSSGEISSTLMPFTPEIIKEKLAEVISIRKKTEPFELQTNKPRLIRYLQSRGFPLELIIEVLDSSS
ncbi:MAG: RecX family transcriptional regulator, partial [Bacteroidetes bacterium]|nr:RecX family transcriptional regulator [Bacteroidota bacterium]